MFFTLALIAFMVFTLYYTYEDTNTDYYRHNFLRIVKHNDGKYSIRRGLLSNQYYNPWGRWGRLTTVCKYYSLEQARSYRDEYLISVRDHKDDIVEQKNIKSDKGKVVE